MDKNDVIYLKKLIENANVISFDIFDTLLLRKVNTPESIFEIVGNNFSIANFQRMRVEAQQKVSKLLHDLFSFQHANMDEIYDELKKYKLDNIDWDVVKNFEYQVEKDALVQNVEMFSIYEYAKNLKKRIIITSDMYLPACFLKEVLNSAGYYGFNEMYISSNERKAKFDSTLFYRLLKNENIISKSILHIGDNFMSDYQMPKKLGIVAYHYERNINLSKIVDCNDSLIDKGIYNILAKNNEFWYNLGLEVGGPMYCGLYFWLENNLKKIDANKTIYFISRDGFNLWEIYKKINNRKVKYVYTSRRALLLAGIADLSN